MKSFLGGQPGVQHGFYLRGELGYAVAAGAGAGLGLLRAEQAATGHGAGQFLTIYVYDVDIEPPSARMGFLAFGHVLLHFRGIAGCGQQELVACIGMLLIRELSSVEAAAASCRQRPGSSLCQTRRHRIVCAVQASF